VTRAEATSDCPVKLLTKEFRRDPYPTLASLQESGALSEAEVGGFRMWVLTRYADVRGMLGDPSFRKDVVAERRALVERSMTDSSHRARLPHRSRRSMLDRDGADHRRLRAPLQGLFNAAKVEQLRPRVEEVTAELLDGFSAGDRVDLIADFARPLVTTIISEVMGVPEHERDGFPIWETEMLTGPSIPRIEEGGRQLYELALRLIEYKRAHPGDDVYTELLGLHDDGTWDFDELASTFLMLLIGGSEPTSLFGNGALLLLTHADQLAAVVADPSLFENCVEEVLRYETPFRMMPPRFSECPVQIGDRTLPAGELVIASSAAANRDPERFPSPDSFDVRRDTRGHLGFGHGPHRCLGAELGRLETTVALRALFTRFPDTSLVPGEPSWRAGVFMRRLDNLPVVLG
jgi:cytochrome P450